MRAAAILVLILTALPARAGEWVNAEAVHDCLVHVQPAERCRALMFAPCASMTKHGFERACTYRLRRHWQDLVERDLAQIDGDLSGEARRWRDGLANGCGEIGRDPDLRDPRTASIRRNQCRIERTALFRERLLELRPDLLTPDLPGE